MFDDGIEPLENDWWVSGEEEFRRRPENRTPDRMNGIKEMFYICIFGMYMSDGCGSRPDSLNQTRLSYWFILAWPYDVAWGSVDDWWSTRRCKFNVQMWWSRESLAFFCRAELGMSRHGGFEFSCMLWWNDQWIKSVGACMQKIWGYVAICMAVHALSSRRRHPIR